MIHAFKNKLINKTIKSYKLKVTNKRIKERAHILEI